MMGRPSQSTLDIYNHLGYMHRDGCRRRERFACCFPHQWPVLREKVWVHPQPLAAPDLPAASPEAAHLRALPASSARDRAELASFAYGTCPPFAYQNPRKPKPARRGRCEARPVRHASPTRHQPGLASG